jgi:hypothetical protein
MNLWLAASSAERAAITDAVNRLDRLLQLSPLDQGESRDADNRILFAAPLGITFEVDATDRRVTVLTVWHFATKE